MQRLSKYLIKSFVTVTLLLPLLAACIYEEPDTSAWGVDPTKVTVTMNLALDISTRSFANGNRMAADGVRRRFIVDVYRADETLSPVIRKVAIFDEANTGGDSFRLPVSLKLDPQDYTLAIWTDYIAAGTHTDLYYHTATLADISCVMPYVGSTPYRDAFYGTANLELSKHAGRWNSKVEAKVELARAAAPFQLVATDWALFVKKHGQAVASGARIKISYGFYIPLGFNALTAKPVRSQLGVSFETALKPPLAGESTTVVATDYIFVGEGDAFAVVNVDITSSDGKLLNRVSSIKVPYKKGYLTTVKSPFLTSEQSNDVNLDVEFDEDIYIDLDNPMKH